MKASELIIELERHIKLFGDLPVTVKIEYQQSNDIYEESGVCLYEEDVGRYREYHNQEDYPEDIKTVFVIAEKSGDY